MIAFNDGDAFAFPKKTLLLLLLLCLSMPAYVVAQSDGGQNQQNVESEEDETENQDEGQSEDDVVDFEPVVATGSRLLRSTYDSISPLQVITAQESREVGQIDAADIVQNATASTGQQIDLTFSGFVLDNGPGARTASFRGLGAGRTLVLLNGRRLAPSGVEGSPTAPDLNLIPGGLVQQYDFLLDGSSSIYGSDAVAGVLNAVLRKDFTGWEVDYNATLPEQGGGDEHRLSLTWGKNFDRGFIGFGAEVYDLEAVRYNQREWTDHCPEQREVTETGEIRSIDLEAPRERLMNFGPCKFQSLAGRVIVPESGSIYYTPGFSNGGWGNFSESAIFGLPIDSDGDGIADIGSFIDYSLYDHETDATLFLELKTQNIMSYGEYTFEGENNITPYYEVLYNRRDTFQDSGQPQFFPEVPADNPYNICNPNGLNGIDCGLAYDALFSNPAVVQAVMDRFGCDPRPGGDCDQTVGPLGPQVAQPVIAIDGDRDQVSTTVEQTRFVVGFRGDLPQLNWGSLNNWVFDSYLSYQKSKGVSSRRGIRDDRLQYSLTTSRVDPNTGNVICGNNDGCVPVNLFAPGLYSPIVSTFDTQAERDYLFDSRDFTTEISQVLFSAFANGYIYDLPAGPIVGGLGIEVRKDKIRSIPDDIARDGLFFGFFSDGGATGSKFTREAFTEIEIPILANMKGAEELTVNLSGRYTKDEFFPSANTYSIKLGYRPIPSLLLRATRGSSYRAPNLRENFLAGQTGFNNVFDPCFIPGDAINELTGGYDPNLDTREPEVLENCRRDGVDPTALNNNGFNTFSTEIRTGGITGITEEESDSLTYGFAWDMPFTDAFDLTVGATYYEVEIDNTIIEPSAQFIVNDCYNNVNLNSAFCSRITRDADGIFDIIDSSFINRDNQTVRGIDVNVNYDQAVNMFNKEVNLGVDLVMTHVKESSDVFLDEDGSPTFDDDAGEFGFPDWSGTVNFRADVGNYRFSWQTRYIGSVEQDPDGVDEFSDINGTSQTCLGPDEGDVLCRDVGFAGSYINHTVSVFYRGNDWTLGLGVRNVFDKAPPEVDNSEVFAAVNAPQGVGYDLNGRRYFINVGYRF